MGYALITSSCFGCGRLFGYNPLLVPSIQVNSQGQPDPNGKREPICRACVEYANSKRIKNGLEPIEVHPQAYEPVDEYELP